MTRFRFVPLAIAISSAMLLAACNTAPPMPMGSAQAGTMAAPNHMAMMDAQMKSMREMHAKMMGAKTADERNKMMAEHMKSMQGGMAMMEGMGGMGDMKGMQGMSGDMAAHQQMMAKRMEMMQLTMKMMMDRMPDNPAR